MEEQQAHADPDAGERARDDRPGEPAGEPAPEDRPDEPGAEGGSRSSSARRLPGMPAPDDETPLGDTDQHSTG